MGKQTIEELEAQVKQLAAENAALKMYISDECYVENKRNGLYACAGKGMPQVSATDAIFDSLRAEAMADGIEQWADCMVDISEYDHIYACDARNYAETLRSKSEVQS